MNEHPPEQDRLERWLAGTVHNLPARRAPHTLESRVFGELARLAARPWWRRSFGHWPRFARAGFVVACGALAAMVLLGGSWMGAAIGWFQDAGAANIWVRQAAAIAAALGNLAASIANTIPPSWLLLGLAAAALLYVFLFGLGAAAYRLLYLQPLNGR
jgi:hypothetical protein